MGDVVGEQTGTGSLLDLLHVDLQLQRVEFKTEAESDFTQHREGSFRLQSLDSTCRSNI